jgi:hypothetical protein
MFIIVSGKDKKPSKMVPDYVSVFKITATQPLQVALCMMVEILLSPIQSTYVQEPHIIKNCVALVGTRLKILMWENRNF